MFQIDTPWPYDQSSHAPLHISTNRHNNNTLFNIFNMGKYTSLFITANKAFEWDSRVTFTGGACSLRIWLKNNCFLQRLLKLFDCGDEVHEHKTRDIQGSFLVWNLSLRSEWQPLTCYRSLRGSETLWVSWSNNKVIDINYDCLRSSFKFRELNNRY